GRAPADLSVDAQVRSVGPHARRQRQVLVVRAVRSGAPLEELVARQAGLGPVAGAVVVALVTVPGDDPRARGMRRLQVRVAAIERVARAIVRERVRLGRVVAADEVAAPARLVDVVAEKRDEVRLVGNDVAIGAEKSLLVLLAGRERQAQPLRWRRRRGRRARGHDRAAGAARARAGPIGRRASPEVKRYQSQRSGSRPCTSTRAEWAHAGSAVVSPEKMT